ncbi:MAG: glycoside hydrolase 43 family protein [Acidobacteriota bacterium]
MRFAVSLSVLLWIAAPSLFAQAWVPDLGNGKYKNPVIFADYSDPDVIRVGDDFYLVASSFNCMPGIPVLHSKDLVNWQIVGHVYDRLPFQKFDKPAHGEGSWAPSIRFHNGLFYVYFCTPREGLFIATAKDPTGKWDLHHVVNVEMWEDPCPFWDEDGNAYLVRSKLQANILYLHRMSPDGRRILDNGKVIFHDEKTQPTIEGPKFLKKDGYYYILSPAGGVPTGWQTALRSRNIYGPYEAKVVLHKGSTGINGPHQGGIVELKSGQWWFMHFQDRGPYGRIVHLQPVHWEEGWPLMGEDINGDDIGEPVAEWTKPDVGQTYPVAVPQTSDDFDAPTLGLQWQWHANPRDDWYSLSANPGFLRLNAVQNLTQNGNLWFVPNLLLQKFPAPSFTVTTQAEFHAQQDGERCGLVVMGRKWAYLALFREAGELQIGMFEGTYDRANDATRELESADAPSGSAFLRVQIENPGDNVAECTFSYSSDGREYHKLGETFPAAPGVWIGAKVGLFCQNPNMTPSQSYADFGNFDLE